MADIGSSEVSSGKNIQKVNILTFFNERRCSKGECTLYERVCFIFSYFDVGTGSRKNRNRESELR